MNNSYWVDTSKTTNYPKLDKNIEVDVCIVGAGIVGATTAYFLSKNSNLKIAILDKDKVCMGVSANTTAKITSQHGLFYKYLIQEFGKDFAKKYLFSNQEAIKIISEIIDKENIDCDFELQNAYVFATSEEELVKIEDEVKAVNSLGFNAEFIEKIELPINNIKGAIKFPNQAQFNARKYVLSLLNILEKRNVKIFENSKVEKIENGEKNIIYANNCKIIAKYVVLATHFPILNFPGLHFIKMHQDKSYIIGVETTDNLFNGMYINSKDPIISFRTAIYKDNQRLLLIGGSDHKTGANNIKLEDSYKNLENYISGVYKNINIKYRWSTEDCVSLDKVPYIGAFSKFMPNIFIATGFKKWGMTTSHVAAKIITDKIIGKKNIYENIYNSTRLKPIKNKKELYNNLKQTTYSLLINRFKKSKITIGEIKNGEGGIIKYNGKKIGIYKDEEGKIYAVKPYCKHLGCELSWNNLEKTWDCPCHGSRYTYDGKILMEPTRKELEKENIDLE